MKKRGCWVLIQCPHTNQSAACRLGARPKADAKVVAQTRIRRPGKANRNMRQMTLHLRPALEILRKIGKGLDRATVRCLVRPKRRMSTYEMHFG